MSPREIGDCWNQGVTGSVNAIIQICIFQVPSTFKYAHRHRHTWTYMFVLPLSMLPQSSNDSFSFSLFPEEFSPTLWNWRLRLKGLSLEQRNGQNRGITTYPQSQGLFVNFRNITELINPLPLTLPVMGQGCSPPLPISPASFFFYINKQGGSQLWFIHS